MNAPIDELKNLIGPELFESMRELVRKTFPDARAPAPSDELVGLVINALPEEARIAIGIAEAAAPLLATTLDKVLDGISQAQGRARGVAQEDARVDGSSAKAFYFLASATHTRHGHGAHEFTGRLPMVRIQLPESQPTDFETHVGTVYAGDHKVHTVELVREKYREFFSFPIGAVFLTTTARYLGSRFGAIATYEVMDDTGERRAWILEAGMATGESMVLYASPHAQPIERVSWYEPTPFSSPNNWYRGTASFDEYGPTALHVQVSTPEEHKQKQVHMEVRVSYTCIADAQEHLLLPAKLTAEAAMRVAAIAVARGDMNPLYLALAPFGHALEWSKRP